MSTHNIDFYKDFNISFNYHKILTLLLNLICTVLYISKGVGSQNPKINSLDEMPNS